jgi:shikimate dehydrogenase
MSKDRVRLLLGLIGSGIQASLTPAMHEREAAGHGVLCLYQRIDLELLGLGPDALSDLLSAAEKMGFAGLNITHPCKQLVLPLLTDLSEDARALGAVNTVVLRGGSRSGHNTDWLAFAANFREGLPDAPIGRIVQLGAGGAGAATAVGGACSHQYGVSFIMASPRRRLRRGERLQPRKRLGKIAPWRGWCR